MKKNRWIKYLNGRFSAVYEGDSCRANGYEVDLDTPDDKLWEAGILRLYEEEDIEVKDPKLVKHKISGPYYILDTTGKAAAVEKWEWAYDTFEAIQESLLNDLFKSRDFALKDGIEFKGHIFDMRFRNLSYISIISTLINNDRFEDDFTWADKDGKLVEFTKDEFLDFSLEVANKIRKLEYNFGLIQEEIMNIDNSYDLQNYSIYESYEQKV